MVHRCLVKIKLENRLGEKTYQVPFHAEIPKENRNIVFSTQE